MLSFEFQQNGFGSDTIAAIVPLRKCNPVGMKLFLLILVLFSTLSSFTQSRQFKVGDPWPFENAYIREYTDSFDIRVRGNGQLHSLEYHEGLARVVYNSQMGFIDTTRVIAIPLVYQDVVGTGKFQHSRAVVVKSDQWGVINRQGKPIIPLQYDRIRQYEDVFYVQQEYEWGYLDSMGAVILPLARHGRSYLMTREELDSLAKDYFRIEAAEKSAAISKGKAISIAKRHKHYLEEDFPFFPSVKLEVEAGQWVIKSSKSLGTTRQGDCAYTNGCIQFQNMEIVIDAESGKVVRKSSNIRLIPVYE